MASGNYAKKVRSQGAAQSLSPRRATRQLSEVKGREEQETRVLPIHRFNKIVDEFEEQSIKRHLPWLRPFLICASLVTVALFVLISAGIFQRSGPSHLVLSPGAQIFPIQVGGSIGAVNTWGNSNGPIDIKTPIPTQSGPYAVLGKPTLTVDFMNQVLTYYHSPAAGKAQALYDYGVKYGIDPAFALAFFMHESTFGTAGVAQTTLSLSNMRCVPEYPCYNSGGGYAQFSSWEQGFEAWYKLIRNLYIAQWGKVTIDQIIPTYAPTSDGNDEAGYIASLKHAMDTWRAGVVQVS